MRRRTALWLLGGAVVALGLTLSAIDQRMWDQGGPGIVGFELAGGLGRTRDILAEWGTDGRHAARLSLWLDYAYLAAYGAFFALAALATRDDARRRGWRRTAALGGTMAALALAAAGFDAIEDLFLLLALGRHGGSAAPTLATAFASLKFLCITIVIAYVVVALGRRAWQRYPRGALVATGVVVAAIVAFLAVNAVTLGRETKPAHADPGGRILSLPGGAIQVREDGDGRGPPLVLIHGFACSMRWWDRVVPALARGHRVIRIDLLGHGGSAKPRTGYSMEHQADLVAAALRRLGVRRADIVGHSMGGIVATALVQRHRGLVRRVVVIDVPPEDDSATSGATAQLATLPVIGPTIRRVAPRAMIRQQLEETMAPRPDLPDRLVDDVKRTTFTSFRESGREAFDYRDKRSLPMRLAGSRVGILAIEGSRDAIVKPASVQRFRAVPGARIVVLHGVGHSPQLEAPGRTAALIREWVSRGTTTG